MGNEEFARALETMMNDADAAARGGAGDFTDLGAEDLTPAEQALLSAAGEELAQSDAVGFSLSRIRPGHAFPDANNFGPSMGAALSFIKFDGVDSPPPPPPPPPPPA